MIKLFISSKTNETISKIPPTLGGGVCQNLSFNIRRHIFQENVILYPAVLDAVENWDAIATESEKIGYCSFR